MNRTIEPRFGTLSLVVGACLFLSHVQAQNVYKTSTGGLETIRLSDGSRVTLNTNTTIHVRIGRTERRIELDTGEIYFRVAKDPARPFSVFVADRRIAATGGKFSLRRSAKDVRIIVTEGRVQLTGVDAPQLHTVITLTAGTVARASGSAVMTTQASEKEMQGMLSWREGFIEFHDTTLTDALAEFNRYRTLKVMIEDRSIASLRISGRFRSANSEAFLWLLQKGFPIVAEEKKGYIVLKRRP